MSSVLDIGEEWDFMFDKKWMIWAHGWDSKGYTPYNQEYVANFNNHLLKELSFNAEYWDRAILKACACYMINLSYQYPDSLNQEVEQMAIRLYTIVHRCAPQFKYIKIKICSSLAGGNYTFDPQVKIEMDERYFGSSKSTDHTIYPTISTYIVLNHHGVFKKYGGDKEFPKASEYLPLNEFEKGFKSSQFIYTFFPQNDPPYGYESGKHIIVD